MKTITPATFIIAYLTLICGCQQAFKRAFVDAGEIDKQLVNYALPENGAMIFVSQDNPNHPASTLTDGVTSSENWDSGEGWEVDFDGAYEYGGYTEVGESERLADFRFGEQATRQRADGSQSNYKSRGISGTGFRGATSSAVGWVVIELPEKKLVTRVIVHTVDSERYPASKYGISDFVVQYWTPQAKGWNNVNRLGKKVGEQHNSIRNNKQGRVVVRFKPVRTSRIRLVIRLTNDTEIYNKRRSFGYVRGMFSRINIHNMQGTIRLTEIEIYGLEKKHEVASVTSSQPEADEQFLDGIFAETHPELASSPTLEETPPAMAVAPVDSRTQIESVIRAYESAYRNQDLSALMVTISPNYSRDGEDYEQFRGKMAGLFQKYMQINFSVQRFRIQPATGTATVEADYAVALTSAGSSPSTLSGKLFFSLIESESGWQITRIDTQRQ